MSKKKEKKEKKNRWLLILPWLIFGLLALTALIGFYNGFIKEVEFDIDNKVVRMKSGQAIEYIRDTLTKTTIIYEKEIKQLKEILKETETVIKNPKYLNKSRYEIEQMLIGRKFQLSESKRLLDEVRPLKWIKMTTKQQQKILGEIFSFIAGDLDGDKDYSHIARTILHLDVVRQKDSIIDNRNIKIDKLIAENIKLKSDMNNMLNKIAVLELRINEFEENEEILIEEKEAINSLYEQSKSALAKSKEKGTEYIVIGGDTIINEVIEQNIKQYRQRIKYLEKENKEIENKNKTLEVPEQKSISGFYVTSPIFYPIKAKRKKNLSYKKRQVKDVVFEFGLESFSKDQKEKEGKIEVRFGIPVSKEKIDWIKKVHTIPFGKRKSITFNTRKYGKKKKKGVYYLWVYKLNSPDDKPICKLEFAAE